jgi:hypothetical protein
MPVTSPTPVKKLKLDLTNFRTVHQPDELHAVRAIISVSPGAFWALMESLIEDGYLPTENILVLKGSGARAELVVKEGNRRIGALKLIHGFLPIEDLGIPDHISESIANLPRGWKTANAEVPCTVYEPNEVKTVERIRALTHGKDEKAGRDKWKAVARARHNRDENGASEPALDLLEKYLGTGKNLTDQQVERWSGDYPLSVLDEAIKRIAPRFEVSSSPELAAKYPKIKYRDAMDNIIRDIGLKNANFKTVRGQADWADAYGLPQATPQPPRGTPPPNAAGTVAVTGGSAVAKPAAAGGAAGTGASTGTPAITAGAATIGKRAFAVAINDPKEVARILRSFKPMGLNRAKVVTLLEEMKGLKLEKNPIAFCFLLRSMFEISAKAYCEDHKASGGPSTKKANGEDKHLVEVLRTITDHMTDNKKDKVVLKALHGAMTELGKAEGILSVTSMNQLVHNPRFSISASDIASMFGNVFPLLETMNN